MRREIEWYDTEEKYNMHISEVITKAMESGISHISMPTYEEYLNSLDCSWCHTDHLIQTE